MTIRFEDFEVTNAEEYDTALDAILVGGNPFCIIVESEKDLEEWNDHVDDNFSGYDDDIYHHFSAPTLEMEDVGKWLAYNEDGVLMELSNLVNHYLRVANFYKKFIEEHPVN